MANFSRKNNKINISSKDLKKAIVDTNNKLKKQNNRLSSNIKDKEKELKSLNKEFNSESKRLLELKEAIEFNEERFQKIKFGIILSEKDLSNCLNKETKAKANVIKYEESVLELEKKEELLNDKISKLEFYKSKCEESKIELAGFQVKKDKSLEELDKIEDEIAKAVDEAAEKIAYYEDQYIVLEEQAKEHESTVKQFEERLIDTQDLYKDERNKLEDLQEKYKIEKKEKDNELQAIKNLCNNTEDKYIQWEIKVKKAEEKVNSENEKLKKAKENFSKWKIGVLEEVAKLKLKSKVDNIDKAGLSDILNG
jgi:chromosome segregation ATPase